MKVKARVWRRVRVRVQRSEADMKNHTRRVNTFGLIQGCAALILTLSALASAQDARTHVAADTRTRLPTGAWLDTAGRSFDVGNMPLAMLPSPDGRFLVVSLS